jgi:hypothetical protein
MMIGSMMITVFDKEEAIRCFTGGQWGKDTEVARDSNLILEDEGENNRTIVGSLVSWFSEEVESRHYLGYYFLVYATPSTIVTSH